MVLLQTQIREGGIRRLFFWVILASVGWSLSCYTPSDTLTGNHSDNNDDILITLPTQTSDDPQSLSCPPVDNPINMPVSSDSSYPTIYLPLSSDMLREAEAKYIQLHNNQICSRLDRYGWPDWSLFPCEGREKLRQEITSEARMITMAKETLVKIGEFTGVADTLCLAIRRSLGVSGCVKCDGSEGDIVTIGWRVDFVNQVYEEFEVPKTGLNVMMDAENVWLVGGHWYPEIHIPEVDQISPENARESVIGIEIVWYDFGGSPQIFTVTSGSFTEGIEKAIVPVINDNSIEVRVAWQLGISMISLGLERSLSNHPWWFIYIDTTTGEIIQIQQLFST